MASSARIFSKLSSRLQPFFAFKLNKKPASPFSEPPLFKSASPSPSRLSRSPVELSCLETMLPLHSAIASARLNSSLSINSQSWGLVPQGISMPL